MTQRIERVKDLVLSVLELFPRTRKIDKKLIITVWDVQLINNLLGRLDREFLEKFTLDMCSAIHSSATLIRVRRHIQNDEKLFVEERVKLRGNLGVLKKTVEDLMTKFPNTRNSDKLLIAKIWTQEIPKTNMKPLREFTDEELKTISNPASIVRVRSHIQNDEDRLIPTVEEVIRMRAKSEESMLKWLEAMNTPKLEF